MSTIFDALKRSDRERQSNMLHTMSYSHLHEEKRSSFSRLWYLLPVFVFLVICFAAIYLLLKKPEPVVITTTRPVISQPEASQSVIEEQPVQAASALKKTPPMTVQTDVPRQSLAQVAKKPIPQSKPAVTELTRSEPEINQTSVAVNETPESDFIGYANYSAIRSSQNLPDLHLDILMYHPNVSQRKAFINLKAYQQGEKTPEGVEVLKISEQGVLLNYQGQNFVLSTN